MTVRVAQVVVREQQGTVLMTGGCRPPPLPSNDLCVFRQPPRGSQTPEHPTIAAVMPLRRVAAVGNGGTRTGAAAAGLDARPKPLCCPQPLWMRFVLAGAGQGLLHCPATSLCRAPRAWGGHRALHHSPGPGSAPFPADAAGWSCSALPSPPLLLAALPRASQAVPGVQEPPWMCHVLVTLAAGRPEQGLGLSPWL